MCPVWPSHSKWLSKHSNKSAPNLALSLNISPWKLFRWFRRTQLWTTGDWQLYHNNVSAHASYLVQFSGKTSNHPGNSVPLQPSFGVCNFCFFSKLKSPLKGKRLQTIDEIQENMTGQLMVIGRTVWGPKVTNLKGTEASLSCVQCFLYLVSFSMKTFIFILQTGYFLDLPYIYEPPQRKKGIIFLRVGSL